jgi:hypothetical protein
MTDPPRHDAPTIDYRPAAQDAVEPPSAPRRPAGSWPPRTLARLIPGIGIVTGGEPPLSAETRSLLRSRLRAVSLLYMIGHGLFLIRNQFLPARDPVLTAIEAADIIMLGTVLALLTGRHHFGQRSLRNLEWLVFLGQSLFFATAHYRMLTIHAARGDTTEMLLVGKDTTLFVVMMVIVYGLAIPNTWRRAARVVAVLVTPPVLASVMLRLRHPEVGRLAAQLMTFEIVSDNLLSVVIAAAIAIYGAHVMHRLRVEVYEARQLGQYRLGRRLGSGGMGEVFQAEHRLLKRPCAIKLIAPERAADPGALVRFEREVQTSAQLTHPNTIEIYDYGHTEEGAFYYVMEYLEGLSLHDLVARHGPLPPGRVVYLLRQACWALGEAHAGGLIHRDIKPANIFASRRGGMDDFVKLLDFGLVKPLRHDLDAGASGLSRDGAVVGSPQYMAPEQAGGSVVPDRRADIYALGCVAYFLLTGQPPFVGETPLQVLIAHARDPIAAPTRLRPGVPADLERVVLRCLEKSPEARFPDVESLDRALAACACAADWSAEIARQWWARHEPGAPGGDLLRPASTEPASI